MANKKKPTVEEVQGNFCAVLATLQEYQIVNERRRISDVAGILDDIDNFHRKIESTESRYHTAINIERMKVQMFAEELYKMGKSL